LRGGDGRGEDENWESDLECLREGFVLNWAERWLRWASAVQICIAQALQKAMESPGAVRDDMKKSQASCEQSAARDRAGANLTDDDRG
jgi:hypothetical protein